MATKLHRKQKCSGEEQIEIQEALEATDAWQRYLEEGPETHGIKRRGPFNRRKVAEQGEEFVEDEEED